jgi:hypothetical protein
METLLGQPDFGELVRKDVQLGCTVFHNIAIFLCERLARANHDIVKLSMAFSLALER